MELIDELITHPLSAFVKNSRMMLYRCEKPNYAEFNRSVIATVIGFVIMGLVGFFVKVAFIPINNVILGA